MLAVYLPEAASWDTPCGKVPAEAMGARTAASLACAAATGAAAVAGAATPEALTRALCSWRLRPSTKSAQPSAPLRSSSRAPPGPVKACWPSGPGTRAPSRKACWPLPPRCTTRISCTAPVPGARKLQLASAAASASASMAVPSTKSVQESPLCFSSSSAPPGPVKVSCPGGAGTATPSTSNSWPVVPAPVSRTRCAPVPGSAKLQSSADDEPVPGAPHWCTTVPSTSSTHTPSRRCSSSSTPPGPVKAMVPSGASSGAPSRRISCPGKSMPFTRR
mmetsp:Transcript_58531/g.188053  ORF Transcript_58531/g.188053 Transcript_58531/m.188053 type:complete len:276 (-) Transcript_58531:403-1230(-)